MNFRCIKNLKRKERISFKNSSLNIFLLTTTKLLLHNVVSADAGAKSNIDVVESPKLQ